MPLTKGDIKQSQVDFSAVISDSDIEMSNIGLTINDLNGPIAYSSSKGLVSEQLKGRLWGKPINLVLGNYGEELKSQKYVIFKRLTIELVFLLIINYLH